MEKLRVKYSQLICISIIILQLLPSQVLKYWPGINHTVYQILYYMKYLGAIFLLTYAFSKPREKYIKNRIIALIKIMMPMLILFIAVEVIAAFTSPIVSQYGIRYWTRFLAYFLDKICIIIEISSLYFICKDRMVQYISTALIIDGFFSIIITIGKTGLFATLKVFLAVFGLLESELALKSLEVHELTYCAGLCLIYYLFFSPDRKKEKNRIILLAIIFVLGGKRIAFAGLLLSGGLSIFVKKKGLKKPTVFLIGILGTLISIGWLAILYDGRAMLFFAEKGINVMGRDSLYAYFISKTKFSVGNFGWGLAATTKAMENMTRAEVGNMVNVRGLHNDILKMYIDCGFVGAIIWYAYNLIIIPVDLLKRFGKKDATMYICLIIFTFVSYLTSNVESAFVFQVILLALPLMGVRNNEIRINYNGEE